MKRFVYAMVVFFTSMVLVNAQTPTVGLRYNQNSSEGFTLFSPEKDSLVFLIDGCGQIVNQWAFTEKPGATCYLLDNGNLLRAGKDSLEIRDWDNNLVWSYAMDLNGYAQHHDIEPLPNGNVLCLLFDFYTDTEMISVGRDSTFVSPSFRLDKIIELQPVGANSANLIWEWKFKDHLIQDYDSTQQNYGVVSAHPELLDINYANNQIKDYTHGNGIDYNSSLDQIIISARHTNEIYVIDHSTTTAEAAGHSGGNANRGGDFLWRWGNSQVYTQDTTDAQMLFLQHDAKWVEQDFADAGKISVFNNGGDGNGTHSSTHLVDPIIANGQYEFTNGRFGPFVYDYTWTGIIMGDTLIEGRKSGVESLANGNVLICESSKGQITEVDKQTGNVIWVYRNPLGSVLYAQGSTTGVHDNSIFRAQRYPTNFAGFVGKDLTPQGIVEDVNSLSSACVALSTEENSMDLIAITNPVRDIMCFNQEVEGAIEIFNMAGQSVLRRTQIQATELAINLPAGVYIVHIDFGNHTHSQKIIIQ